MASWATGQSAHHRRCLLKDVTVSAQAPGPAAQVTLGTPWSAGRGQLSQRRALPRGRTQERRPWGGPWAGRGRHLLEVGLLCPVHTAVTVLPPTGEALPENTRGALFPLRVSAGGLLHRERVPG